MKINCFVVAVSCLLGRPGEVAPLAAEPVDILSPSSVANAAGGVGSYAPSLSADGRYVVFLSHARNLTTNSSLTPYLDVYRHDLNTTNTILVSTDGLGTGSGNTDAAYPAITPNGRFVAFASRADNLVSGDTNNTSDVFVRDLDADSTSLISAGLGGVSAKGNATFVGFGGAILPKADLELSGNPSISADGRFVVFESAATNLVALADTNTANDIFIRDRQTGVTELLSVDDSGISAGNAPSELPSATPDARRVAFVSYATNLVAGVTNNQGDIYVRDRDAGTTAWASVNVASHFSNGVYRCYAPVLSANGEVVAFKAGVSNASSGLLFRVELATGVTMLVNSNSPIAAAPSLSDDGRILAYDDGTNVYVCWAGTNLLVSTRFNNGSEAGNGPSRSPVLSANGRTVAFVSAATDLLVEQPVDTNALFQIYSHDLQSGVIRLITADSNGQPVEINQLLANISLSADGTRVAFDSRSDEIVPGDANRESDVFVTDLVENKTRLISRHAESRPSVTGARRVRIASDCLSANGRYLLFASVPKTSPEDTGCCENLFLRDLVVGTEEQVTAFDEARPKEHVLSADGRTVAYIVLPLTNSTAESVVVYDRQTGVRVFAHRDPVSDGYLAGTFSGLTVSFDGTKVAYRYGEAVCLFDTLTARNRIVSERYAYPFGSYGSSGPPAFSPDGHWLAFGSEAPHLINSTSTGLFVWDVTSTNRLSVIPSVYPFTSHRPSFSADSRFAITSQGNSVVALNDLLVWASVVISSNFSRRGTLTADGSMAAYEHRGYTDSAWNIQLQDIQSGAVKVVSISTNFTGGGNGDSSTPLVSRDGRYVVYASRASNLAAADTNRFSDIYARDVVRGVTILLSVNHQGQRAGNSASTIPVLSADGRTVIFQSFADDLVEGDFNFFRDIFVVRLSDESTDGDNLDDDWEMAFFGTLDRDGNGDFDGDGTSDFQEFLAGSDPTNLGSVLRVITVAPLSGGQCTVLWASASGRTYKVQCKDNVDAAEWTDLPGTVTATGSTASMVDASASPAHRYYRVVLVQ